MIEFAARAVVAGGALMAVYYLCAMVNEFRTGQAVIRAALGLPPTATVAEIVSAIEELRRNAR